ncbi:MAG: hypothetical protein ACFFBT_02840 [Promethearchaeota archaeon]
MSLVDNKILQFVDKIKFTIRDETIPPRITKAIRMFKKESNLLYIDKDSESLRAIVKSQTHPDKLEYAILLNNDGSFFCGTQNLYPCGGLRGKICKHIILALIATVKSNQGTVNELIKWVDNTKGIKPKLNKPQATAIFVRYENALEGKIEWRPIEILPEDFMAF